jgi:hypothetical protein
MLFNRVITPRQRMYGGLATHVAVRARDARCSPGKIFSMTRLAAGNILFGRSSVTVKHPPRRMDGGLGGRIFPL